MKPFSKILLFLLLATGLSAQVRLSPDAHISLLTCAQGEELYSVFGHSAVWVNDPIQDIDQVFNYGIFDFDTPNFYVKFVRGQLPYKLGVQRISFFMREYQHDQRSVWQQQFQLEPEEKQAVYNFLVDNYKPEKRYYLYDFFYDNCASRIVDVMDTTLTNQLMWTKNPVGQRSFRSLLDDYIADKPWTDFALDLILGQEADLTASFRQQMFLPKYLSSNLTTMNVDRDSSQLNLLSSPKALIEFPEETITYSWWQRPAPLLWVICLLLLALGFWLGPTSIFQKLDVLLFLAGGLAGSLFLFMWLGTDHDACHRNFNMLWANPLYLLLLPALWRRSLKKTERIILLICGVLNLLAILGWKFLPQELHVAAIPLMVLFLGRIIYLLRGTFHKTA